MRCLFWAWFWWVLAALVAIAAFILLACVYSIRQDYYGGVTFRFYIWAALAALLVACLAYNGSIHLDRCARTLSASPGLLS